jgi:predicted transcriptional regulator
VTAISLRTDDEFDAALIELGVTPDARNRSEIIRKAVLSAAADARRMRALQQPSNKGAFLDALGELSARVDALRNQAVHL